MAWSQIGALQAVCHPTKCDIIDDVKIVDIIQSDDVLQKQVIKAAYSVTMKIFRKFLFSF